MKDILFILIVIGLLIFNYIIIKKTRNKIIKSIPCVISLIASVTCFIMVFGIKNPLGIRKGLTIFFVGIFSTVSFIISLIMLIYDFKKNKGV